MTEQPAKTTVTYRRSVESDFPAVFGLVSASVSRLAPAPYDQKVVDTWMTGRAPEDYRSDCASGEIWIAEAGGAPIGFAHGVPGEVKRLFVDAGHVGKGVGAGLMERALKDSLPGGAGTVKIDATLNAVPFYQRWGFEEIGHSVFPGRDDDLPTIDVVVLERVFPSSSA